MYDCNTTIADSPTLTYKLSGTDLKSYKMTNSAVSITGTKWGPALTGDDAKVTWAMSADLSTAPTTTMSGTCPDLGLAYGWFAPVGTTAPSASNVGASTTSFLATK